MEHNLSSSTVVAITIWVIFVSAVSFFLILYYYPFIKNLFEPKIKIIKARIIRYKTKEIKIPMSYQDPMDHIIPEREYAVVPTHFLFIEDENKEKYFISIPADSYLELEKQKSFLKYSTIIFYFKKYFLAEEFDHFEVVTSA